MTPDPVIAGFLAVWFGIGSLACAITHSILGRWPGVIRVFLTACLGPLGLLGVAVAVVQRRLEVR
jgi:hypothetical protein